MFESVELNEKDEKIVKYFMYLLERYVDEKAYERFEDYQEAFKKFLEQMKYAGRLRDDFSASIYKGKNHMEIVPFSKKIKVTKKRMIANKEKRHDKSGRV